MLRGRIAPVRVASRVTTRRQATRRFRIRSARLGNALPLACLLLGALLCAPGFGVARASHQAPNVTFGGTTVASIVTMRGISRTGGGTGLSVVRSKLAPSAEYS